VRKPYCQALDLRSGEIVEIHVDVAGVVYLTTEDNLQKYRAGRVDYAAEESLPFASPIELVARKPGRWYLMSEQPLGGSIEFVAASSPERVVYKCLGVDDLASLLLKTTNPGCNTLA
jgi:hypothetical protein